MHACVFFLRLEADIISQGELTSQQRGRPEVKTREHTGTGLPLITRAAKTPALRMHVLCQPPDVHEMCLSSSLN